MTDLSEYSSCIVDYKYVSVNALYIESVYDNTSDVLGDNAPNSPIVYVILAVKILYYM